MKHREYVKKPQEKLRIIVSYSLSGERLEQFREQFEPDFEREHGRKPNEAECRRKASDLALEAIDFYCNR